MQQVKISLLTGSVWFTLSIFIPDLIMRSNTGFLKYVLDAVAIVPMMYAKLARSDEKWRGPDITKNVR